MGSNQKKGSSYCLQFRTSHVNVTLFLRYLHGIKQSNFCDSSQIQDTHGAKCYTTFWSFRKIEISYAGV